MPLNGLRQEFFVERPTPLEGFLPFEVASPLSRIYLVLLPLLVLAFPLWTLMKAGIAWLMRGRSNNWHPRIHAIERSIDTSSLEQLEAHRDFLRSVATQLSTKTRVPASYGAACYDLRIDLEYVTNRVDDRIALLRPAGTTGAACGDVTDAGVSASDAGAAGVMEDLPPERRRRRLTAPCVLRCGHAFAHHAV